MRYNLKNRRKKLGLTHMEISKKVGIARSTYTNIEIGTKNPSFLVAIKIKDVLKVKDDNIFLNINDP
ncbi:helix-turn-helix transcriptional regulator [Maledivibacter halophilus]|uniref:Putative transcriptional regulator n=1 Tax=Maledivibacter halophilus TaxID=36842 RepID=A0A1T5JDI2_9FIRM|nr:helix-turn-helix transcriptional regulator [Maledivibacter halophilus]SKC49455.1 putative transcriptional regulator [Maledivibacter halophilus]